MNLIVRHNVGCPMKGKLHSDAAKRISDTYNLHRMADVYGSIGKWIACKLSDGDGDGVLYDSKRDAVVHQRHNERYFAFIQIVPTQLDVCDAEIMLAVHRRMYDKGLTWLADRDHKKGGYSVIQRASVEDQIALARGIVQNIRFERN